MNLKMYESAESKREMGEAVLGFDVRNGIDWIAQAECQEAGTLESYRAARSAWKAQEPRPLDFIPDEAKRSALYTRECKLLEKHAREVAELFGGQHD